MANKKGISPLIGTVLLVAITIAMVLLIMPWITKTIKSQQEKTSEASRAFDCLTKLNFNIIKDVDNSIKIDNKGEIAIKSLAIRTIKLLDLTSSDKPWPTPPATTTIPAYTVVDTGEPCATGNKVEIVAIISSEGKDVRCSDLPVEYTCQ